MAGGDNTAVQDDRGPLDAGAQTLTFVREGEQIQGASASVW